MPKFNRQRLALLHSTIKLDFAKPKSVTQADALEHFQALTPEERTNFITTLYGMWYENQQLELMRVAG